MKDVMMRAELFGDGGFMSGRLCRVVATLTFVFALPVAASTLPSARGESVGMSSERLARITPAVQRYIDEGKLAGATVLVERHGRVVYFEAFGKNSIENGAPMTRSGGDCAPADRSAIALPNPSPVSTFGAFT